MFVEQRRRSIAKAFSWRITATLSTILISWIITGEIKAALQIGFVEFFAKMLLYYGHERIWGFIKFGITKKTMDYQI